MAEQPVFSSFVPPTPEEITAEVQSVPAQLVDTDAPAEFQTPVEEEKVEASLTAEAEATATTPQPEESPTEETPTEAVFKPYIIAGYGVDDDIPVDTEEKHKEVVSAYLNEKAWKRANQQRSEAIVREEQKLRPYMSLVEAMGSLPPATQAVLNDIVVNGVAPDVAVERVKLLYNAPDTGPAPDQNDDPIGFLQYELKKTQTMLAQALKPAPQRQASAPVLPPAILQASTSALDAVAARWQERFGGGKIPGFDLSNPDTATWGTLKERIAGVLSDKHLDPRANVVSEAQWEEVMRLAAPKLAKEEAKLQHPKKVVTATPTSKRPSAGAQPKSVWGPNATSIFEKSLQPIGER